MNVTKTMTETYTLRGKKCLWAKINLDCGEKSVNVMISSDYGEFNYYWGATGLNPKKFLCDIDMHYAMKKLMGGTHEMYEPDFEARKIRINEMIIEYRFDGSISKEEARNAWDKAKEIFEYCQNSNDKYYEKFYTSDEFKDIFYDCESIPECTKLKPKVTQVWNDLWKPFVEYLKTEVKEV